VFLLTFLFMALPAVLTVAPRGSSAVVFAAEPPQPPSMLGFSGAAAAEQQRLETRFDGLLQAENLRSWMQRLAERPHPVGSPWGRENAEFLAGLFRSWGYATEIEEFRVLFPTPRSRRVEMLAPHRFTASLAEPPVAGDSASVAGNGRLPVYNAYSVDGDVTAEVVYVNYGLPDDYEELDRRGISVEGKIVLARYGAAWRGIKPKVAAEHGAVGCLIYSDPRDDGFFEGDPYPEGGYRPAEGAQRGSVADMPRYPGDPLTPFVGATPEAPRRAREDAETLTKIPVLPLSAADAAPLLDALEGPVAPEAWRGALPLTYHLGPGPTRVHLAVAFDWSLVPAYDVVARLEGSTWPDQWVLRGNHHDAWVNGAADPVSGLVALLEEARAVGELAAAGWRPRRTLIYAAWDAEEPGLLGSVEWAETHAEELREKAVAYVNSDGNSRGYLRMGGSHTLERLVNQAAAEVEDPAKGLGVLERVRARTLLNGSPEEKQRAREAGDLPLAALGSGSDYTPFLQHLGVASLNLGYGGEGHYGQYHSAYDSFEHFTRFMDPGFDYGIALARTAGRVVLRLADADVLPFDFTAAARVVGTYVKELEDLADEKRREAEERSRALAEGLYEAVAPPDETLLPPPPLPPVPYLSFAPLKNAHQRLAAAAKTYSQARDAYRAHGEPLPPETLEQLDEILLASERALTRREGLPGRAWYVHHLYAPGFYTGYGVKTLPGVREALEQGDWAQVAEQVDLAAAVLEGFAAQVEEAAELLGSATAAPAAPGS
jgi:N-acetylated-alpha-linked acidic dipeptidase